MEYRYKDHDACNMCGFEGRRVLGRRLNTRQGLRPQKKVGIATTVVQCSQCGLISPAPIPYPARLEQHYGVSPESYWKPEYFAIEPDYLKGVINLFHSLHGANGNDRLVALDVGAGIGKGMIALANAGFEAYGLEGSETFYRMAIDKMNVSPDRLNLSTVEDATYEKSYFDFINMSAVLEHFYDPSAVLKKAVTWLKPGGLVYVEVPSASWLMSRLARLFYRATGSDYVINLSPMHAPFHIYEFTLRTFEQHAKRNGYVIARHDYYECQTYMPPPIGPVFDRLMRMAGTGMQLAVWLRNP